MKNLKKHISVFAIAIMFFSCIPFTFVAAESPVYSDIGNHWAKEAIMKWSERGILTGNAGKFRPDDSLTRAELAAILNKMLGFPIHSEDVFTDISGKWYRDHVNTLAWQNVYTITSWDTAYAEVAVRRGEAVAMIANAFPTVRPEGTVSKTFTDSKSSGFEISGFGDRIHLMADLGFVSGNPNGSFDPYGIFTRAQVVAVLDNMIDEYITKPGTYEVREGARVCVAAPGVTLKGGNLDYLIVTPYAGTGTTVLEGITTRHNTIWQGGGTYTSSENQAHNTITKVRGIDTRFAGGTGTPADPFLIKTVDQLKLLNEYIGGKNKYLNFKLENDLVLTGKWAPIGIEVNVLEGNAFEGTFDGGGYQISGMEIGDEQTTPYPKGLGLFTSIYGTVKNLTISGNIVINHSYNQLPPKDVDAGGFAASAYGATIENCVSHVNIIVKSNNGVNIGGIVALTYNGSTINNCTADGTLEAYEKEGTINRFLAMAGGIAGDAYGSGNVISNCYSKANVLASGGYFSYAGGVVGFIDAASVVKDCYSEGKVHAQNATAQNNAGGIAGQMQRSSWALRSGTSAKVSISGEPEDFNAVGGFAGSMYEGTLARDCYATGSVTSKDLSSAGGFVGRMAGGLQRCYSVASIGADLNWGNFSTQTLVGSVRTDIVVTNCGILSDPKNLHFYDNSAVKDGKIIPTTLENIKKADTFKALGWDFDKIWTMPLPNDSYKLPILRGKYEQQQKSMPMPGHLK